MSLIVNFFAGPSSGKSSLMADVFAQLKWKDINCEMAPEFIKESVWEDRRKVYSDQLYIFGEQHYRIHRLLGEVDVIVTDSPLLLSSIYKTKNPSLLFDQVILDVFNSYNNLNYFVERTKSYNPKGRLQTYEEALEKDREIKDCLNTLGIEYITIKGNHNSAVHIAEHIVSMLGKKES